jgi:hypothetical protein
MAAIIECPSWNSSCGTDARDPEKFSIDRSVIRGSGYLIERVNDLDKHVFHRLSAQRAHHDVFTEVTRFH